MRQRDMIKYTDNPGRVSIARLRMIVTIKEFATNHSKIVSKTKEQTIIRPVSERICFIPVMKSKNSAHIPRHIKSDAKSVVGVGSVFNAESI